MAEPRHRHAVVTGASSGIGAAIAARLLDEGWRVTGISRTAPPHADDRLRWLPADLARPEELPAALTPMAEDGPLDALVHAAGVQRSARLGELDAEDGSLMWRHPRPGGHRPGGRAGGPGPGRGPGGAGGQPDDDRRTGQEPVRGHQGGADGPGPVLGGRTGTARGHRERGGTGAHGHPDAARPGPQPHPARRAAARAGSYAPRRWPV